MGARKVVFSFGAHGGAQDNLFYVMENKERKEADDGRRRQWTWHTPSENGKGAIYSKLQISMLSPTPKFPKSQSLLDTMTTQTRSNLSIPDPPVISLPGKSWKRTPKPAPTTTPGSVPVTTDSSEGSIDALALDSDSGETVPASLEVAQVDITEVTKPDTKSSADKVPKFSFASLPDSRPTTSSATPDSDKKPSFDDSANAIDKSTNKSSPKKFSNNASDCDNKKKNNNKKNDKSSTATPPSCTDFSTLFCMFFFDTDPTRPLLAQRINDNYDLLFHIEDILEVDGSMPVDPSFRLRAQLKYLLVKQAVATGDTCDDGYMSSNRQLIVKTITDSFTFSCDLGNA